MNIKKTKQKTNSTEPLLYEKNPTPALAMGQKRWMLLWKGAAGEQEE